MKQLVINEDLFYISQPQPVLSVFASLLPADPPAVYL